MGKRKAGKGKGQATHRKLVTKRQIALAIAPRDLNAVIHITNCHPIVQHVPHHARAPAPLQVAAQLALHAGPYLNPRAVRGVEHADILDQDTLHDIRLADILPQRADGDAVGAVAMHILDEDGGRVGFEGDAVVAVIDGRVLDCDGRGAVRVPAVCVFGRVVAFAVARDEDVTEDDGAAVGDEVVVLWRVDQVEIPDKAAVQADGAEEDGTQDVLVCCVQVVPDLPVAVERAAAVDVDVGAAELEEGGCVLVDLFEGVCLPVVGVVGEEDVAADVEVDVGKEG